MLPGVVLFANAQSSDEAVQMDNADQTLVYMHAAWGVYTEGGVNLHALQQ